MAPPGSVWFTVGNDDGDTGGRGRVATGLLTIGGCRLAVLYGGTARVAGSGASSPGGDRCDPSPFRPDGRAGKEWAWWGARPRDFA